MQSPRFWGVVRRNLLVWRKLAVPSVIGNIAEPLSLLTADVEDFDLSTIAAWHIDPDRRD